MDHRLKERPGWMLVGCAFLVMHPLAAAAVAQSGTSSACNNLTRTLAQPAGVSGSVVQTSCAQITVTVAGQSFSTPSSCPVAWTQYLESVYTCGPAATDLHCDPEASQSTIKNYTDGACPDVAGLVDGMSWASWEDVPENLQTLIRNMSSCVRPQVTETFDYSARTRPCKTIVPGQGSGPEPGWSGTQWYGNPCEIIPPVEAFNPFTWAYEVAAEAGEISPQPQLQAVRESFPGLDAASVHVEWHLQWFEAGQDPPVHQIGGAYRGLMTQTGLFDLVHTGAWASDGERVVFDTRQYFDGQVFRIHTAGSEEGNAFSQGNADSSPLWTTAILPDLRPIYWWVRNPFQIDTFSGRVFEEQVVGGDVLIRLMQHGPAGAFCSREYRVSPDALDAPVITSLRVLDQEGKVVESMHFGDFRAMDGGAWRPMTVEYEIFIDREPNGRRLLRTYRYRTCTEVDAMQAASTILNASFAPEIAWNIWQ